jgi:hypothetical protein
MSKKKIERALYGPSWTEVILGAVLSLALGIVLGGVYLVLKPVATVKELPKKDAARGVVYYIEGSKDANKGRQWLRKRQQIAAGQSVGLTEDELNTAFAAAPAAGAAPAAPVDKSKPAPLKTNDVFSAGAPNFRLLDGQLQVAVPCTVNVFGFTQTFPVIAKGGFAKKGDVFVFEPETFYVGSLAANRLPILESYVMKRILAAQPPPDDLVNAWKKLSGIAVEDHTLRLSMQ